MNIKDFTEAEKQALLELATLAMYADGHLASAEDERVHRLLEAMGFATGYESDSQYDAAIARVSRHSPTAESARHRVTALAQGFANREQRLLALRTLSEMVASDSHISLPESELLSAVREVLEK